MGEVGIVGTVREIGIVGNVEVVVIVERWLFRNTQAYEALLLLDIWIYVFVIADQKRKRALRFPFQRFSPSYSAVESNKRQVYCI